MCFQLFQSGENTIYAFQGNCRKSSHRVVPCVWQAEKHGEKPLCFQTQCLIPQMVVRHGCVVGIFLYPENSYLNHLLTALYSLATHSSLHTTSLHCILSAPASNGRNKKRAVTRQPGFLLTADNRSMFKYYSFLIWHFLRYAASGADCII